MLAYVLCVERKKRDSHHLQQLVALLFLLKAYARATVLKVAGGGCSSHQPIEASTLKNSTEKRGV